MLGTLDRHPLMSLAGSPSSPSAEPGIVYALLALQADAGDMFVLATSNNIYLSAPSDMPSLLQLIEVVLGLR